MFLLQLLPIALVLSIALPGASSKSVTKKINFNRKLFPASYAQNHPDVLPKAALGDARRPILVTREVNLEKVAKPERRPNRATFCKKRPEIQPRNITQANLNDESTYFLMTWSDCKTTNAVITSAQKEWCIFDGVMEGDPASKVVVTGCFDEDNAVQIHSKVHGDQIFETRQGRALALEFDPEDYDYIYDDYIYDDEDVEANDEEIPVEADD